MFWRKGFFLFICKVTADGDLVLDSWLGSFVSCHRWKWDNKLPRLQQRNLRTKTNAFIVSLAVADSRVGLGVIPSLLACDVTNTCYWPQVFPSWNDVVRWLLSYLSVLNLCFLVLDRYIAIVKPFKYIPFMTIVCYASDNFLLDSVIYTGCVQGRTSALL